MYREIKVRAIWSLRVTALALLIEAARPALSDMLGNAAFEITVHNDDHCSIGGCAHALQFYRVSSSGMIHSSIRLGQMPVHPVRLSEHLHSWLVLKSLGEAWPEPVAAASESDEFDSELGRLARALVAIGDAQTLDGVLLWEAGYRSGYLSWD
jgi:hypothetical protein